MGDGPTKKQLRMVDAAIKKASAMVLSEDDGRVDSEGLKRMTRDYFGGSEVKASIVRIILDGLRKAGGEPSLYRKFTTVMQVLKVVLLKIFKGFMQLMYGATRALAGDAQSTREYPAIVQPLGDLFDFDDLKSGVLAYLKRFGLIGPFAHAAAIIVFYILAPLTGMFDRDTAFGSFISVIFSTIMVVVGGPMLPLYVICICGIVVATWYVVNRTSKLIELTYEKVDDIYTRAYDRLMSDVKDVPANMASEKTADTSEKATVAESIADTIRRLNAVMA